MFVIISLKKYRFLFIIVATFLIVGAIIIFPQSILKFMYPLKHSEFIFKYSEDNNIDPYLTMAIIKVESDFDINACSHKGAKGLMQLTDQTAQWGAKEIGLGDFNNDKVYDVETNIAIGCWYINKLMKQFNNDLLLVLAAYNAGSGNVSKWLKDERYSKSGKKLDQIPFRETEYYLKKVTKDYKIYKQLYSKK